MGYRIISPDKASSQDKTLIELYDKALNETLESSDSMVIVSLSADLGAGLPLIEWIIEWQNRFLGESKEFLIVAADPLQRESLEFSHPDQQLSYYTSIKEINLPEEPVDIPVMLPEYRNDSVQIDQVPAQRVQTAQILTEEPVQEDIPAVPEPPPYVPSIGSISSISGEFECLSCKVSRMWLKGDTVGPCDNPECIDNSAGWKLTYELF